MYGGITISKINEIIEMIIENKECTKVLIEYNTYNRKFRQNMII